MDELPFRWPGAPLPLGPASIFLRPTKPRGPRPPGAF